MNCVGFGRAAPIGRRHEPLENAFGHQGTTDFRIEFVAEPAQQAPDLDPAGEINRQQAMAAKRYSPRFIEIFRNDRGSRYGRMPLFQQHRGCPGRVESEKFMPALPRALLDEHRIETVLAHCDADEPGMRTEGMMKKCEHWLCASPQPDRPHTATFKRQCKEIHNALKTTRCSFWDRGRPGRIFC